MNFIRFYGISWNFIEIHKFHKYPPISPVFGPATLARKKDSNSYGFSMVAARTFLPGHSRIWFFMKILDSDQNNGEFHEIWWNLAPELGFKDSEGSLAGPGWKPQYSYRNIEVSEPPRTTRIAPKQKKLKIPAQIALFHSKTGFSASGAKKKRPRTLRLCRVLGRGRQCRFLVPQMRFWCPKT